MAAMSILELMPSIAYFVTPRVTERRATQAIPINVTNMAVTGNIVSTVDRRPWAKRQIPATPTAVMNDKFNTELIS